MLTKSDLSAALGSRQWARVTVRLPSGGGEYEVEAIDAIDDQDRGEERVILILRSVPWGGPTAAEVAAAAAKSKGRAPPK